MSAESVGISALGVVPDRLVPLEQIRLADAATTGRKAAVLGELSASGYPVPSGFVITAAVHREAVTVAGGGEPRIPEDILSAVSRLVSPTEEWAVRSSGIAEDLDEASYAGMYETVLGVRGAEEIASAVGRCWSSVLSSRVGAYDSGIPNEMAVLVQRLVRADAAGVAFSAHPVTGERDKVLIHAVLGLGERLVSGEVNPEQWLVTPDGSIRTPGDEKSVLSEQQVADIAALVLDLQSRLGSPQDVEWAFADGRLHLLQARPITALPDEVEWVISSPGGWVRNFRLGEWIGEPLTPLFDSWLLARIEQGFFDQYREWFGIRVPLPHHLTVNGWYYATLPGPRTPKEAMSLLPRMLGRLAVNPRRVSAAVPPLAGLGMDLFVRDWLDELLPAYQEAVATAERQIDDLSPAQLIEMVDHLGCLAGRYFASMTVVAGYGWKTELPLARFYRKRLAGRDGTGHQTLLVGLSAATGLPPHAVSSLDWSRHTLGEIGSANDGESAWDGSSVRAAEEERVLGVLGGRQRRKFERLVSRAREAAVRRDAQIYWFTLAWPVLRRAVMRLGDELVSRQVLRHRDEIFFLTFDEMMVAVDRPTGLVDTAARRRGTWTRQGRLNPPPAVGKISFPMRKMLESSDVTRVGDVPAGAVKGEPASPGRVTGVARVIRSVEEGHRLAPGEILIAPLTTPAWTPLFRTAAAVVTDVGSVIAHASLLAREYGIPAVVGTINATSVIADGEVVTVDGRGGFVQRGA